MSPVGGSILITSAPKSAMTVVETGPAMKFAASMTRMPSRSRLILGGVDREQLHLEDQRRPRRNDAARAAVATPAQRTIHGPPPGGAGGRGQAASGEQGAATPPLSRSEGGRPPPAVPRGGAPCMILVVGLTFNPMDPDFVADPYPTYHRLRLEEPVHRSPLGFWVLTRYDDVVAALRDPRLAKSAIP